MTGEPTTEAGRRLLAGMPWTGSQEKALWGRLIVAIEREAVAAALADLRAKVEGLEQTCNVFAVSRTEVLALLAATPEESER